MNDTAFQATEEFAATLDARDPLRGYREQFHIPRSENGGECVYLSGHSLGLQPKRAREYIEQELVEWARLGVEGHFHARDPWMSYHRLLTEQTAELVGAKPAEIVVMPPPAVHAPPRPPRGSPRPRGRLRRAPLVR